MQDYRTLKILDRFEKVFSNLGVDYKVMRRILQVKLTMDGRRVPTIFSQNSGKQVKETTNQYIKSLWIYVFFGLFLIPFILLGNHYLFQMSIFYGIFTIFIMTSLISDFSSVLLDIRDRNILYPKPVDRRTISTAKMVHVFIYLSFLTIALAGIPLIVGFIRHGFLFFILSFVNIIFIDLLIVILTAFIYMFILQFFDGEKLKDIINYVQIGLSLGIMVGYQLLIRSFDLFNFTITFQAKWWQLFIFPMWYGANTELVMNGNIQPLFILLTVLSVLIPLISIWVYIKLNPTFEQNLQKLTYHGKAKERKQSMINRFILKVLCPTKEERSFFRFASLMMKNERDFKLKVYPSLGFSIVIPFLFFINGINNDFEQLSKGNSYFSIYFSLIIIPTIIVLLKFSGKYKGAWIYKAAPIQQLKPMFSAVIKAFLFKLYLPVYLFLSVLFIWIFGVRILPDLLVVFINACIYAVLCFMMLPKTIPFSESFDYYNQNNKTAILLGLMVIVAVFAGLHYISTLIHFGIYLYLVIAIVGLALLWKAAFNISWENIEG
ncbi:hypothetical protein H9636_12610 [Ureibacillus sp. Re31]|uniref:ABC transporter permease n=1 Tax=Ureibacillus galli TaxID=2762222 RepID=A0ABR8XE52_9BACL|nr:hypothetical protein [Ureibacillus galli]MBD8027495.1 hypothetical protein [Ureibacillus galli]